MRRRGSVSIGPGAASLILIFVMLSMSILAMLSVMTGRADLKLAERSVEVAEAVYALNDSAERSRQKLDIALAQCRADAADENSFLTAAAGSLPEGMTLESLEDGYAVSWTEEDGTRTLECAVRLAFLEDDAQAGWLRHDLAAGTEDEWNW